MERYPYIRDGEIKAWILSSSEFSIIDRSIYFWTTSREVIDVSQMIKWPYLEVNNERFNLITHIEDIEWPYISLAWNLDEYVDYLRKVIKCDRPVLLNFSGGKDSVAAMIVLLELGCEVKPVYSYVNYLESIKTQRFLDLVERKLGIEIIRVEAGKEIMRSMLEKGMPYRGNRWCTYLKVKPIRKLQKRCDCLRGSGERLTEAFKRFKVGYKKKRIPIQDGIKIRPVYPLTLIDVVKIVRDVELVHPDYYEGLPRVACVFCPYKTLFEFSEKDFNDVEDPGVIESAIKASYKRFKYKMDFEEFWKTHSWRFPPSVANFFHRLRSGGMRMDIKNMYKSLWMENIPKPRIMKVEEGYKLISAIVQERFERVKNLFNSTKAG